MSPIKKIYWIFFMILEPIMVTCILLWLFVSHGSLSFFQYFFIFKVLIIGFIVLEILSPIIAIIDLVISSKKKVIRRPRRIVWVMFFLSILIPAGFFGTVSMSLDHFAGDTPPQLLLCDGTGVNGVPDMAIVFWTQEKSRSQVLWGTGSETHILAENQPQNSHMFLLTGLLPGTEYWYQINNQGENFSFRTPQAIKDTLKFAIASDSHFGPFSSNLDTPKKLLDLISNAPIKNDLFFMLGDFVDVGFWDDCWKTGLELIHPCTSKIPFRPLIGNHDSILGGAKYYLDYFYPDRMPVQTGSRYWYKYDINNIHFLMLDIECDIIDYTPQQEKWFEEQIKTVPKEDWTIIMTHMDFDEEMLDKFHSLFMEYDVDLVFSGHSHQIEIVDRSGIVYNELGTFSKSWWYHFNSYVDDSGYMEVNIQGDLAILKYINSFNETVHQINMFK